MHKKLYAKYACIKWQENPINFTSLSVDIELLSESLFQLFLNIQL